ncbi:MAG: thymidine phosphorylase [Deltaproteobacteria bacterium]|nr:thymidine phosphorylase [Deltaproteobacteria bacterium]
MSLRAVELIARKRDGGALTPAEIRDLVAGYTRGDVPDYQMAAFAMAVLFRGMDDAETAALLDAMQHSGDVVTWDHLDRPTADKHSTGGVGDKVSIPLAPAVAACGVAVPMISGRGLGHTGGTLDKLEAIPGFDVRLDLASFARITAEVGTCLIGQTDRICPADRKLYALRDVTATIESIPLIVASILSKKLAEGAGSLVLDVKVGSGAFMKDRADALRLAQAMVRAAQAAGRNCTALLTAMDRPTGTHIGNALEIAESIEVLRGGGPADTRALVVRMGGEMLRLAGVVADLAGGEARIARALEDGSALDRFARLVRAQKGDARVCDDPWAVLPRAPIVREVRAQRSGTVARLDALQVGLAAVRLGAGRDRASDDVDPAVGFVLLHRPGAVVRVGERLALVHGRDPGRTERAVAELGAAFEVDEGPADGLPLWIDVVQ